VSKSVFVSHAVKDKELAHEIVSLMEEGMGVPEGEIFCSSLQGYGIPSGQNFVTYIKKQMLEPKMVILLLTPAYFESKFCVSELGAAWIKSHSIFPIIVPPLTYGDVKDVLLGTQVAKIDDDIKYNELRESLVSSIGFNPKTITKWDVKRRAFLKAIKPMVKRTPGPSLVSSEELKKKDEQINEARTELDALESENRELRAQLKETEALKDKAAVKSVSKKYGRADVSRQFDELVRDVKKFRWDLKGSEMFKYALADHYGKPYKINWYEDEEEFQLAVRHGLLDVEDGERILWSARPLKELSAKLGELETFVTEHAKTLEKSFDDDVPLDPGIQGFWEYHYEVRGG
jgi:hypothetical protein